MFPRPYSTAPLGSFAEGGFARDPDLPAGRRVRVARGLGLVGAGYLLFLSAYVWSALHAAPAAPRRNRGALVVGALGLLAGGIRALRGAGGVLRPRRAASPRVVLPPIAQVLGGAAAPGPAVVFIGRLYALGPAGWTLVAATARRDAGPRAAARGVLHAVTTDLHLQGAERRLTDAVGAVLLLPGAAQLPPATRAVARGAAFAASLAVLARPSLPARDFELLYAPFARLIPAHTLWPAAELLRRSRA